MTWLLAAIAAIMVAEVAVLAMQPPARRARFLPTVLAGLFIVVAWNASVRGLGEVVVLAALSAALAAHAVDLAKRWRDKRP